MNIQQLPDKAEASSSSSSSSSKVEQKALHQREPLVKPSASATTTTTTTTTALGDVSSGANRKSSKRISSNDNGALGATVSLLDNTRNSTVSLASASSSVPKSTATSSSVLQDRRRLSSNTPLQGGAGSSRIATPIGSKKRGDGGAASKAAEESVSFILSSNRDNQLTLPYHECGNPKLYTAENLKKRAQLKENRAVIDAVDRFSRLFPPDCDGFVPKEVYVKSHAKLCTVLRPSLSASEIQELCEVDWKKDTNGKEQLSVPDLKDMLFEFVDVWTQTTDPAEYLVFLDQLFLRIRSM